MFLFKCGSCGFYHRISEESVQNNRTGKQCINCGESIPYDFLYQAYMMKKFQTNPNFNNWQFFRIPDEVKVSLDMTLHQE